ncbi:MAG: UDP-N-acetylmuramate dehydrogenase [Saprospiraceae bacterium]
MVDLLSYNTFGIRAAALDMVHIKSETQLIEFLKANHESIFILGGGSNILFCKDVDAHILRNEIRGIEIIEEDDQEILVKVGGGEIWHELVQWAIDHNYGGIENLSLIPGTVGAAPIQNIGAYGVELKDVFDSLTAINTTTFEKETFSKEDCHFDYRDSFFKRAGKGRYFICSVCFKLKKFPIINVQYGDIQKVLTEKNIEHPTIKDISEAVIQIRRSKLPDPKVLGNAGSFFKNPTLSAAEFSRFIERFPQAPSYPLMDGNVKVPAGWLIEQAGWKGKRVGNSGCHEKQALVLVNYGNATGQEIVDLALMIQKDIWEKFEVQISPEVNWI